MSYIDSILEPGEQVRYRTTVSWTIYTPVISAICALAAALVGVSFPPMVGAAWFASTVLALGAIVAFIPAWLRRWYD